MPGQNREYAAVSILSDTRYNRRMWEDRKQQIQMAAEEQLRARTGGNPDMYIDKQAAIRANDLDPIFMPFVRGDFSTIEGKDIRQVIAFLYEQRARFLASYATFHMNKDNFASPDAQVNGRSAIDFVMTSPVTDTARHITALIAMLKHAKYSRNEIGILVGSPEFAATLKRFVDTEASSVTVRHSAPVGMAHQPGLVDNAPIMPAGAQPARAVGPRVPTLDDITKTIELVRRKELMRNA